MVYVDRLEVERIVAELFKDGESPAKRLGIDVEKIEEIELKYPHVSKQYPSV